ncbi:(deoxy)nucleoside triphosphate pyrophosphohydrolase [Runella zeae]|jgi:8-oxo-dGTP diphosphatase|uniref:(deoxy)nucleoside triphosphate pyrophosphohydrolase n=1 Tax=Runella zeae TaxID=94255 RepID=UPI000402CF08|nr:(deoxy)nucleoside triphosphate pyrophosphohydrolase [Runella zeae]
MSHSHPSEHPKKLVIVPCAIFEKEGRIFAAQRSDGMSLAFKWEFPGGKVEEGESEEETLHREIMEEMSVEIEIGVRLAPTYKEDTHRIICLVPYICRIMSAPIVLTEHLQYKWVKIEEIYKLDWAEADLGVIQTFFQYRDSKLLCRNPKLRARV